MAQSFDGSTAYTGDTVSLAGYAAYGFYCNAYPANTSSRMTPLGGAFITGAAMSNPGMSENNFFLEFNGPSFSSGRSPCNYAGGGVYPPSATMVAVPATSGYNYAANVWRNCSISIPAYAGGGTGTCTMYTGGSQIVSTTQTISGSPNNLNKFNVGSDLYGIPSGSFINRSQWFTGGVAKPAMWDDALSDRDQLALSQDISPLKIRTSKLREYYPLCEDTVANMRSRLNRSAWTQFTGGSAATQRHPRSYGR